MSPSKPYKKSISPVVATALLMVVAVVAIVSFQGWFQTYSSQIFTQTESQGKVISSDIVDIQGDTLYFRNGGDENVSIKSVRVGGTDCSISRNVSEGLEQLSLSTCLDNVSGPTEVLITTTDGVSSKQFYLNSPKNSSSLNIFEDSFESWSSGTADAAPDGWEVSNTAGASRTTGNVTDGSYAAELYKVAATSTFPGIQRQVNFTGKTNLTIDYALVSDGPYKWNVKINETIEETTMSTGQGTMDIDVSGYEGSYYLNLTINNLLSPAQSEDSLTVQMDNLQIR